MEKQPWLNILGKPAAGNMQPCEKPCATAQSALFNPPKIPNNPNRLLAGQNEDISQAQRSRRTQKHSNVTKARTQ